MLAYVTGAAGFIGSHLVDCLLALGYRVIGADNFVRGRKGNLAQAFESPNFRFYETDLADRTAIIRVLDPVFSMEKEEVATVWHMAANSDIGAGAADPGIDLRDTFLTTFETLALMRRFGMKRLAFASTSAVYGERPGPLREDSGPLLPISSYGAMKLASEAVISAAVESYLQQAWIFRLPNVIGSRGTHGVIYDLISKLLVDQNKLEVLGNGEQKKPYLHVLELLEAMIYIHRHASERRALYNIGPADEGAKVSFIAETLLESARIQACIHYTGADRGWVGDVPHFSYSIDKLGTLGWLPRHSSDVAVRMAIRELIAERGLLSCK